jgi:hypothetical protein
MLIARSRYGTVMVPSLRIYGSGTRLGDHDPTIVCGFDVADDDDDDDDDDDQDGGVLDR